MSWSQQQSAQPTNNNEDLYQQIRTLEKELKKANDLNAQHVRRWEKLKESAAKKKRENRNSQESLLNEEEKSEMQNSPQSQVATSTMYYSATSNANNS